MKKSIFLFFAAILCAMTANAAVPSKLYLDASGWGYSDARYAAYFMPQNSFVNMTKATGEVSVFEVAVPASQTKVIFVRMDGSKPANDWANKWNQTGDLTIPTDGKNKFKPSGWDGATTTWSTYTYTPPTFYIAGDFVTPQWSNNAAANKMDYTDGVFSKSYNNVTASAHQFKITNGTWDNAIGYNSSTCSGTNCSVTGKDGNIQFTPLAEGTVTITYTLADGKVHITCPEPPAAEHNITYPATETNYTLIAGAAKAQAGAKVSFTATPADGYVLNVTYNGNAITGNNNVYSFTMPAADVTIAIEAVVATTIYYVDNNSWENANAYMWNDGGNNGWPGVTMTKVGTVGENNYAYYSVTFAQGTYTSIIFNNGSAQTADLTIDTAKPYFYDGAWYTWDELSAKLAAPVVTYNYYITGSFNGDDPKKAENGMTLDGEVYKATVTLAEGDNTLKVTNGSWDNTWGYSNLGAAYEEVSDAGEYNNIKITLAPEAEKNITVIFNATTGKVTFEGLTLYVAPLTYTVTVPAGTEKCYIAGNMNSWAFQEMEAVTGETNKFTITIAGAKETDQYKYACQADWAYAEVIDGGGNRTKWTALDNVTAWNKPAVITYQLKGVDGWDVAGIEMTENPYKAGEYKLTCQAISANDAVKVVKLADGVITDYYGNGTVKDGVEVTVNYDGDGNITLPEGTYDFYFDTNEAEKKLWIAAATGCAPATATITLVDAQEYGATLTLSADEYAVGAEITASAAIYEDGYAFAYWKENDVIVSYKADYTFTVEGDRTLEAYFGNNMPVEMADLVFDADAKTITGSNTTDGVTASLKLDEYDSDMDLWSIDPANSTIEFDPFGSGTPVTLDVLYGEVWLDMDAFSMADARVVADFGGELFVFNLTMTAATETLEVGVGTELSLEFGALVMRGTWYDENEVEYPFEAQVGGFDYTKAEQECMTTVSLGNFDDDTNWLGMAQGLMTVTVADGIVELTGTVTTMWPVNTLNIVAQGNIQILPMDIDVTVAEMDMGGAVYLNLNGTDYESGIDVDLYLNDYTGADETYELNDASTIADGNAQATGSLTKAGNTYTGVVYASAMGALYVLELNLTEFVPEYENIVVTGLSGAAEARSLGWGNEYYLALSLEGTWSDGVVTYPVSVELADYDPAVTSGTTYVSLSIGGWEDDQEWLGSIDGGEMNFSISGKTITLTGKLDNAYNWPAPIYWDLTITGTILPNYTRDVTAGNFGTLCLPFGGTVEGAELFECVGKETGKVYIASVTKLEAGVPYIFLANANQIAVYCDATVADEAGNHQGLYGTFDDNTVVEAGNYILLNNELRPSDGTAKVNANRAYLVMSGVPTEPVQQMPGRRYIGMSTQGENAATGLENIIVPEGQAVKVISNGQLIIIRDGEMYNAMGVKL